MGVVASQIYTLAFQIPDFAITIGRKCVISTNILCTGADVSIGGGTDIAARDALCGTMIRTLTTLIYSTKRYVNFITKTLWACWVASKEYAR
jgi:uncharacterized MnhB-related membrane protein